MNKLVITGNLTADPELRTTQTGKNVCNFTVAVNRRNGRSRNDGQSEADFFRVTAWDQLGENCAKYLTKGKKVGVFGAVSLRVYQTQSGETRANMEVAATDVEFLSPRSEDIDPQSGMQKVDVGQELPY